MDENEEFEFRARAEKEAQQPKQKPGLFSKGLAYARLPSQALGAIMGESANKMAVEPNGNMARDIAMNIPSIAMKTLSKTVPTTYTPENLATMGAVEGAGAVIPKMAPFAKGLAGQLESAAGSPAGTLEHGFESAKNIFGPGREAAKPGYQAAGKVKGGLLGGMYKPEEIVDTVSSALKRGDPIHPSEALKYRKALDVLSKSGRYIKDELFEMRTQADKIVKQNEKYAMADPQYKTGLLNESLRAPFPKNKNGSTAFLKSAVGIAAPVVAPLFSPAIQGAGATAAGSLARGLQKIAQDPEIVAVLSNVLKQLRGQSATPQTGQQQ